MEEGKKRKSNRKTEEEGKEGQEGRGGYIRVYANVSLKVPSCLHEEVKAGSGSLN